MRLRATGLVAGLLCLVTGCADADSRPSNEPAASASRGLLVALAQFEVSPEGKVVPKPKAARLEILVPHDGRWETVVLEDPESNVFHKAMVYDDGRGRPGILTLGGSAAVLKLWRKGPDGFVAETIWKQDFGGKFSRMREAEVVEIDGKPALAVATHDRGVVAIVTPDGADGWSVTEIDRRDRTFVHEIEVGDLDGDGIAEVYATPSERNLFDGKPQHGEVVRYASTGEHGRSVAADLGDRHAKEILVRDVDGDGRDELYVSVEAVQGGRVEIRRYDHDTDPAEGRLIASLDDQLCRFLTAGDVDGDGKLELVAAGLKSGLWLLRPQGQGPWQRSSIDRDSSGFEHAALLTDLDGDATDELYVASDDQGEVRRYTWRDGAWHKDVLQAREVPKAYFTWNLMPVPLSLVD